MKPRKQNLWKFLWKKDKKIVIFVAGCFFVGIALIIPLINPVPKVGDCQDKDWGVCVDYYTEEDRSLIEEE